MDITIFPDVKALSHTTVQCDWPDFVAFLEQLPETPKNESSLIKLCSLSGEPNHRGCVRYDEAVTSISGIECDYDRGELSIDDAAQMLLDAGVAGVLVPTHSYTEESPRWRFFGPTSQPLAPSAREGLVAKVNGVLGGVLATESFTLSQSFYVGAAPGADYFVIEVPGTCIDQLDLPEVGVQHRRVDGTVMETHDGTLSELLVGEDMHGCLLAFVNKRVVRGWSDEDIRAVLRGAEAGLCAARGVDRVQVLLGSELDRILSSARAKGMHLGAPSLTPEQIAQRRQAQRQEARQVGLDLGCDHLAELFCLEEMQKRFIFVEGGNMVFDTLCPRHLLSIGEFRNAKAGSFTEIPNKTGGTRKTSTVKLWQESGSRVTAKGLTFHAGAAAITLDPAGRECANLWNGWRWPDVDAARVAERGAGLFVKHVEWLFGDRTDHFLDWIAHMIQRPGELPHTAWVHVAPYQGTGRGWLSIVLAKITRGYCAASLDLVKLLENQFNQTLSGKVLAIIDEIREGGNKQWANAQKMKSLITEDVRNINAKFLPPYTEVNSCRWLLFSNHYSAIPLGDGDRRFEVAICNKAPLEPEYYARLYVAKNDDAFIRAVAEYLLNRDISGFDAGRAALATVAKRQVIEGMQSNEMAALLEAYKHYPYKMVTAATLRALADIEPGAGGPAFGHEVEDAGWVRVGRYQIPSGKKETIYCRRQDADVFVNADARTMKAHLATTDGGTAVPNITPV